MIAIIRIKGMVNINEDVENTLSRLRLRRKYACTLVDMNNNEINGVVKK